MPIHVNPETGQVIHLVPFNIVHINFECARSPRRSRRGQVGERRFAQCELLQHFAPVSTAEHFALGLAVRGSHNIAIDGHGIPLVAVGQGIREREKGVGLVAGQVYGVRIACRSVSI